MAHEFNIKNGFITSGQSYVYNNLTVTGLTLSSVPANDDTLTQILARDSSGVLKYRTASSLGGGGGTFTGGTVSGATNFTNGLTANTISATTYQNLPLDIRTTGATYSNNTFTYTNNTGGTYSVLFNTVSGLTVSGTLDVTNYIKVNTANSTDSIAGTDWLKIDASGTVFGFSDNAPSGQGFMSVTNGTVTGFGAHVNNTDGMVFGSYNSYPLTLRTANNNRLVISSGGDVNIYQGLTVGTNLVASTISATTYYNLPTDIRVTGGTYSNGTATFTNNTGGTFSVTGFSTTTQGLTGLTASNGVSASTTNNVTTIGFSGGTISSPVNFTNGLSANTISATTYQGNVVTSVAAGNNISVNQSTGDVTVTATPSGSDTAIQFNNSNSFDGDSTTFAYIQSQVTFIGGSTSYTLAPAVTNSSIVAGDSNLLGDNISRSVIVGGRSSEIRGTSVNSVIIGGDTNSIVGRDNAVILGGSNITATSSDFVYVPSLNINTVPTNDDTLTQVLVRDSGTGDVKYRNSSTLGGGGGTFTGGTVNGATIFTAGVTANTLTVTGNTNISGTTTSSGDITGFSLVSSQSVGDEGGEIRLAKAQTNTTLSGTSITIDIYQNRLRFFETGSPNRGAYIDLTAASSGVGTNLLAGGGGGTFTGGTVTGPTTFISGVTANTIVYSVVTLSSGATIAVNAVLGNEFKVTLGGNSTLGNPTGAVDGQYLRFAIRQDSTGGRNLTFDTKYRFGNEIGTPSVDLTANKTSYLGVRYNSADDKFDVISFVSGY